LSIFLRPHYGKNQLSAKQILKDPVLLLAFGFGSGLSKYMPGTLGTLAAVPIYLALMLYTDPTIYLIATALSVIVGIWICDQAAKKLAVHDFGGIVWDEVAGFLITLYGLPLTWQTLLAGFVAFRLFDIVKPWPIRYLDKQVGGGFGIMLDDVVAGIFAALVLRIWF
jgi:phosphatidylglycerophosphatase A